MINAHNVCLNYGERTLFNDISFTLNPEQKIGLVGLNGSGKSTLLKLISGLDQQDSGTIALANNKTLAYMPQEVVLQSDKTILQETFTAHKKLQEYQKEVELLEPIIHKEQDKADQKLIDRYITAQEHLAELNADKALAQTKKMLMGLGFSEKQFDQPVDNLSVGWKMRVVLAKLLLQKADFYLFDEPTNHLDIVAKDWFINFLKEADFGFMIVCHERFVLDQLCDYIFELENGNGTMYTGNYSQYEKQKKADRELLYAAYKNQQREIKQKMKTYERFRAKASRAKMAKNMLKQVDRMEKIELPPEPKKVTLSFNRLERPGRVVLNVENVCQQFDEKEIFKNVSFIVERGQKIAVIAPNGAGKTTLFNLIVGKLPLQKGTVEMGYNAQPAIFDQDQTKSLKLEESVLDNVLYSASGKTEQQVRNMLGAFLFSNDEAEKKVKVLSGGEKNRVGMAKTLLQDANILLLDEPTNHLDIPSKEILLRSLQNYPGTMLFVSHDHDFINHLATHVLALTKDGCELFEGNYQDYVYAKKQRQADSSSSEAHRSGNSAKPTNRAKQTQKKQSIDPELQKEARKLEKHIDKLEQHIAKIEQQFSELVYGTKAFDATQKKLQEAQALLEQKLNEWEELHKNV